jgi:hypothetical protein
LREDAFGAAIPEAAPIIWKEITTAFRGRMAEEWRFVKAGGVKATTSANRGPMNTDDPIIAAIEAHRRACAETRAAFENQSAVENELS